mmetsp:Transcript_6788/g.10895  ORF Transcript_6788/g.10895 Transcript_6788/m.10895 type:complete len:215 (-) Transcript_6788:32-676(-)
MFQCFPICNSDSPILTDLLERLRDEITNGLITIRGNSGNTLDALRRLNHCGLCMKIFQNYLNCLIHASLDIHRTHASCNSLAPLTEDCPSKHSRRSCAIASDIVGFAGHTFDKLCPHIDHGNVFQLDRLRHSDAILRHFRRTEGLLDDHISTFRAHSHCDSVCQLVATFQHQSSRFGSMSNVFGSKSSCSDGGECCRYGSASYAQCRQHGVDET